jgi:hypothetical protein
MSDSDSDSDLHGHGVASESDAQAQALIPARDGGAAAGGVQSPSLPLRAPLPQAAAFQVPRPLPGPLSTVSPVSL